MKFTYKTKGVCSQSIEITVEDDIVKEVSCSRNCLSLVVSEIVSDYWIDKLVLLATALTKVTLGRIRSRYTQSNALWSQDGEALLSEGNAAISLL